MHYSKEGSKRSTSGSLMPELTPNGGHWKLYTTTGPLTNFARAFARACADELEQLLREGSKSNVIQSQTLRRWNYPWDLLWLHHCCIVDSQGGSQKFGGEVELRPEARRKNLAPYRRKEGQTENPEFLLSSIEQRKSRCGRRPTSRTRRLRAKPKNGVSPGQHPAEQET